MLHTCAQTCLPVCSTVRHGAHHILTRPWVGCCIVLYRTVSIYTPVYTDLTAIVARQVHLSSNIRASNPSISAARSCSTADHPLNQTKQTKIYLPTSIILPHIHVNVNKPSPSYHQSLHTTALQSRCTLLFGLAADGFRSDETESDGRNLCERADEQAGAC